MSLEMMGTSYCAPVIDEIIFLSNLPQKLNLVTVLFHVTTIGKAYSINSHFHTLNDAMIMFVIK